MSSANPIAVPSRFDYTAPMSLRVHFYGHSSLCLETADEAIFFHPNFSLKNLGATHNPLPSPPPSLLDKVHTIILSSGHFHHCDLPSFKFFSTHTSILCPVGLGTFLSRHFSNPIIELHDKSNTPYRNAQIATMRASHTPKWLRPFRGSDQLNFLLDWQDKTLLFFFHPSLNQVAPLRECPIDLFFLSLNDNPWKEIFFSKKSLSPEISKIASELHHATQVIPIGWSGLMEKSEGLKALSALESSPKLRVISPGQSVEI